MVKNFEELLKKALHIDKKNVVVIYPNNEETFAALREVLDIGLARLILVGDPAAIF